MSDITHPVAARMIAHASINAMKSEFVLSSDEIFTPARRR